MFAERAYGNLASHASTAITSSAYIPLRLSATCPGGKIGCHDSARFAQKPDSEIPVNRQGTAITGKAVIGDSLALHHRLIICISGVAGSSKCSNIFTFKDNVFSLIKLLQDIFHDAVLCEGII